MRLAIFKLANGSEMAVSPQLCQIIYNGQTGVWLLGRDSGEESDRLNMTFKEAIEEVNEALNHDSKVEAAEFLINGLSL